MDSNLLNAPKQKFLLSKKNVPFFELNPKAERYNNDETKDENENDEILFNESNNLNSIKDSMVKISISSNETEEDSNYEFNNNNNNNSFEEDFKQKSILSLLIAK